jgi:type VI secretion system ImpM family protein
MAGEFAAFGKIPALGDFFRLNPPPGFVPVWDSWLQAGLLAAHAQLGDRWDACYMSAPIWRFSLAAGLAGPAPLLGVMMPSVDRVGRQFPLTLVVPVPTTTRVPDGAAETGTESGPEIAQDSRAGQRPGGKTASETGGGTGSGAACGAGRGTGLGSAAVFARHLGSELLFEALELVALDALEDGMTRDGLRDALAALGDLPGTPATATGAGCSRLERGQGVLTLQTGTQTCANPANRSGHAPGSEPGAGHQPARSKLPPARRLEHAQRG